jgi:lambda family phage portal protein
VLSTLLRPIASTIIGWVSGYHATDPRRKIVSPSQQALANKASANQLLNGNLSQLRSYCRELERNNPTARAGIEALVGLVVGSGIRLEPDTGDMDTDDRVREIWCPWCDSAGVYGESIYELQSLGFREIPAAGECLWRLVPDDNRLHGIGILPYDPEWLRDDVGGENAMTAVAGIELDKYGRPKTYLLQNPETGVGSERVDARQIIHCFERRRSIQHRGEPWFAPLIETLMQERDLVSAELEAAVNTASLGIGVESEYQYPLDNNEYGDDEDPAHELHVGGVVRMLPGDKIHPFSHSRPSQQIAPFRQMLRGDIAAALRIPQRFLDRDVTRANYSSMRADMIDTERLLGPVRNWYGNQSIGECYRRMLPLMAAKLGIPVPRAGYRLVPDGQPYVDPQKDIAAALEAINGNLSTYEAEVGKRGGDYRSVLQQRANEIRLIAEILGQSEQSEQTEGDGDASTT